MLPIECGSVGVGSEKSKFIIIVICIIRELDIQVSKFNIRNERGRTLGGLDTILCHTVGGQALHCATVFERRWQGLLDGSLERYSAITSLDRQSPPTYPSPC